MTLGHPQVRDYRKDDRRERHDRKKSKPVHKGTPPLQDWIAWIIRQIPAKHISGGLAEIKMSRQQFCATSIACGGIERPERRHAFDKRYLDLSNAREIEPGFRLRRGRARELFNAS